MWDKAVKNLAEYPTAVLTGIDSEGYPFSIRCKPEVDAAKQVLYITVPDGVPIQTGPAGLLCHYHDDLLWNLKNFILRGTLEKADGRWVFHPTQFIEGAGRLTGVIGLIRNGRRAAKQYLDKRGLARPKIPWDKLREIYDRAQKS